MSLLYSILRVKFFQYLLIVFTVQGVVGQSSSYFTICLYQESSSAALSLHSRRRRAQQIIKKRQTFIRRTKRADTGLTGM